MQALLLIQIAITGASLPVSAFVEALFAPGLGRRRMRDKSTAIPVSSLASRDDEMKNDILTTEILRVRGQAL